MDGLSISDVEIGTSDIETPPSDFRLVDVGPKSYTNTNGDPNDPSVWVEVYSPDRDAIVRHLKIQDVYFTRKKGTNYEKTKIPAINLVRIIKQKVNSDYPITTPKGGTGKGVLIP